MVIVAEETSFLTAADLLTVELSRANTIQVLERSEIDRVYREQGLSAANKDYLKLGQVLGANGVLLLSTLTEGTNQFLQARLLAVGPGVVIGSIRAPWPIKDPAPWADRIAHHFRPLMPKLTVPARDAFPVAIVNFRSAIRSREQEELEQQLTALTAERLSHEREFFVLERQRMDLLGAEKDLRGTNETQFWNGGHLLEGVVDRDGFSKETVTLNARLLPSKGGAPLLIDVSGSRTNLSGVLESLTRKIRDVLKLEPNSVPWNAESEAEAFFQEAQWAFKWDMLQEARSAAESSWALGRQTRETAELRVRIYGAIAGTGPWVESALPNSPAYRPNPAALQPAIRALEIYEQGFRTFLFNDAKPDTNWHKLGLSLLRSELLRRFNHFPDSCKGHEQELATMRLLSRNTALMIQNHPPYTNMNLSLNVMLLGSAGWRGALEDVGFGAAYWQETPEDGIQVYRQTADTVLLHTARWQFVSYKITGWNQADKDRCPELWRAFIDELCASTNPSKKVEGYYLSYANAQPEQMEERAQLLFKVAIENAASFRKARLHEGLVKDVDELIGYPALNSPKAEATGAVRRSFRTFRNGFEAACESAARTFVLADMTNFLATRFNTNRPVTSEEFVQIFLRYNTRWSINALKFEKPDAQVLTPLLREFKNGLVARAAGNETETGYTLRHVDNLLTSFEAMLNPPDSKALTNIVTQQRATNYPAPAAAMPTLTRRVVRQLPSLEQPLTNTLKVNRFWQWPPDLVNDYDVISRSGSAIYREGRVWMQVLYKSSRIYLTKAFIFGVDLATFSVVTVELPLLKHKFVISDTESRDSWETGDSFEVAGDHLFFTLGDKIKRYSLKTKTWEDLAVPTAGKLTLLDGRLFATTDDSIAEISLDGNTQTVMASSRRRPPTSILDSMGNYKKPMIFRGPGGSVATIVEDRVFLLNEITRDWSELTHLPVQPTFASNSMPSGRGAFGYSVATWRTNQLFVPGNPDSYAMVTPPPPGLSSRRPSFRQIRNEDPLWQATARIFLPDRQAWLFFSGHFVEKDPAGTPVIKRALGEMVTGPRSSKSRTSKMPLLNAYWKQQEKQLAVPLEMDLKKAVIDAQLFGRLDDQGDQSVQPIPTPAGIVVVNPGIGLWMIPWAEVEAGLRMAGDEQMAAQRTRSSAVNGLWANLEEKYQIRRTNNLTPEQKESIIDDPAFVELSLDRIDVNHNGMLDAAELIFFDANENGILDAKEYAGIQAAVTLTTPALLEEYDLDQDGQLNWLERSKMQRENIAEHFVIMQVDGNHDQILNEVELNALLSRRIFEGAPNVGNAQFFRRETEVYWVRSGARPDRPELRPGFPMRGIPTTPASPRPDAKSPDLALLEAAYMGNTNWARTAIENGAKVDVRDDRGWTPLMVAAQEGKLKMVAFLVEKGADVNAQSTSKTGSTVLCFAIEADQPELMALLVKHGADINGKSKNFVTPLYTAATNKKMEAAKYLLSQGARTSERGFQNEVGQRYTPLMAAAISLDGEMVRLLQAGGASLEDTNTLGDTTLMILAKMPQPDTLKLLIELGANVNACNPDGYTALIYAAAIGETENVKLLLAAGADPNATVKGLAVNNFATDALSFAEINQHPRAAAMIRQARQQARTPETKR